MSPYVKMVIEFSSSSLLLLFRNPPDICHLYFPPLIFSRFLCKVLSIQLPSHLKYSTSKMGFFLFVVSIILINFQCTINLAIKPETCQNTNGTAEEGEADRNHCHVCQVDDNWEDAYQIKTRNQEPERIKE